MKEKPEQKDGCWMMVELVGGLLLAWLLFGYVASWLYDHYGRG